MDAIFEPSLLFISEADWNNEQTKDNFLELSLCHLETIDKYDICDILWSDELENNLFEDPNIHPWYEGFLRNPIIVTIYNKFHSRQKNIQQHTDVCSVEPAFSKKSPKTDSHANFLKLVHTLLDRNENFYLCVGNKNKLLTNNYYIFKCNCGNQLKPTLLNECCDWFKNIDVVKKYFPANADNFETKLEIAINIIKKVEFEDKPILFDYKFTKTFKKDVIKATNHKQDILLTITRKLILTANEARQDSQLRDEYIQQRDEYRIRVTDRPYSTRIHYNIGDNNVIEFLRYYDEGEHDDGL